MLTSNSALKSAKKFQFAMSHCFPQRLKSTFLFHCITKYPQKRTSILEGEKIKANKIGDFSFCGALCTAKQGGGGGTIILEENRI